MLLNHLKIGAYKKIFPRLLYKIMMAMNSFVVLLSIAAITGLVVLIFVAVNRKAKMSASEKFFTDGQYGPSVKSVAELAHPTPDMASSGLGDYAASDPQGNSMYGTVDGGAAGAGTGSCFPRDRLSAEELLPKDAANSKWAEMNPSGQGDVRDSNFLSAGYHVGINTTGSSLKNPNYQLRSEPPNPQVAVSPWQQSSITPDLNRRSLEVGGD